MKRTAAFGYYEPEGVSNVLQKLFLGLILVTRYQILIVLLLIACSPKEELAPIFLGEGSMVQESSLFPLSEGEVVYNGAYQISKIDIIDGSIMPVGGVTAGDIEIVYKGKESLYLYHQYKQAFSLTSVNLENLSKQWVNTELPFREDRGFVHLYDSDTLLILKGLDRYYAFDKKTGELKREIGSSDLKTTQIPPLKRWGYNYPFTNPHFWGYDSLTLWQVDPDTVFVSPEVIKGGSKEKWAYQFKEYEFVRGNSDYIGVVTNESDSLLLQVIDPSSKGNIVYQSKMLSGAPHRYYLEGNRLAFYEYDKDIRVIDLAYNKLLVQKPIDQGTLIQDVIIHSGYVLYLDNEGFLHRIRL